MLQHLKGYQKSVTLIKTQMHEWQALHMQRKMQNAVWFQQSFLKAGTNYSRCCVSLWCTSRRLQCLMKINYTAHVCPVQTALPDVLYSQLSNELTYYCKLIYGLLTYMAACVHVTLLMAYLLTCLCHDQWKQTFVDSDMQQYAMSTYEWIVDRIEME